MANAGITEKTIKTLLKRFLLLLPGFQSLSRRLTRDHVRAIMYHRFSAEGHDHPRRLPVREFAWQAAYLTRHHTGWRPDDQLAALGKPIASDDGPPVVITIDDGYADFASLAYPLLQRHSLPATVFVTTGFISGETWFWWDRLSWLLESCPAGDRRFRFAGREALGDAGSPADRWSLWHTIADHLSVIDDERKEAALTELGNDLELSIPATAPEDYQALTWDQVRELAGQGVVFGAHTVTHPVLSRVDAGRAEWEIRESGTRLAAETGQRSDWFCYPQGGPGDFRSETVQQVRQAGYRGCYTAYPEARHDGNPATLPRYSVSPDRTNFQWVLCGAEFLQGRWLTRTATPNDKDSS